MSTFSDTLMFVTIIGYLAAMVLYAAEHAFGNRGVVARAAARTERAPAMAGAPSAERADAAGGTAAGGTAAGGRPPDARPAVARVGQAAQLLLVLAVAAHAATAATRGIAAERLPWGNMYEFVLSATLVAAAVWLVVQHRHPSLRHLGLYVALANVAMLGLVGIPNYTPVGPLVPALDSYWFVIHVASASLATGIFLVGFAAAVMFLIRTGYERGRVRFPYPLGERVPAAEAVERMVFRVHAFAFPVWTFAVMAGAIWAESAWGRYWGWDPKEVWAFISWVLYAGYLHARATPTVRRTSTTWLVVAAFVTMLINLVLVNLYFGGNHSYA